MYKILTKVINLIYESSCLICNSSSKDCTVCTKCESNFVERQQNHIKQFKEIIVYSWGFYNNSLRDGIINLKAGKKRLANYFSKILADFWNSVIPEEVKNKDFLVIPVPSHSKRVKERGYCQSSLIASDFANYTEKRFSNNLIKRTKETLYMNSLNNLNERIANIQNAFTVNKSFPLETNILIIDDILTSGSTFCEIARTIHRTYPESNLIGLAIASGDTYN